MCAGWMASDANYLTGRMDGLYAIALGTWSHLGTTWSSARDVCSRTAALSLWAARFAGLLLTLRTTELADSAGHRLPLQAPFGTRLISTYDVPLYVDRCPVRVPSRPSISPTTPSWPANRATRRCWPACPRCRSPVGSATRPARPPGRSAVSTIIAAIDQVLHGQAPATGAHG
jgi:hypothetical protein